MVWTAPRTWVAAEKPSASTLNVHIRDNLLALGGARTAYTPTLGNSTLGNGTITGNYINPGKFFAFRIRFILGSTSAITGSPTFTLPVSAVTARILTGTVAMWDSSAATVSFGFYHNSAADTLSIRSDASAAISSTVPFTWATSDEIYMEGTGEMA